jgi:hypothetical protein
LQQLTPPFRRFFQKIWSGVTSIDISLCLSVKSPSNTNDVGRCQPYSSLGHGLWMECWIKVMQYFNMHLSMDDYQNLKLRLHCLGCWTGEDMVKAVPLDTWAEAGSNWCEIWKVSWWCAFYYVGGAPKARSKKTAKEQIFIAR